ncbi:MAG: plastocyanin/azurin family copper-binding protein [Gammaproteobacteria bacterium]|nr:plastocyanin/azurin family copper-binding protein [Gammaproteobacteria bacterium]
MTDIRFDPASIRIEPGETVRFVLHNRGDLVHEFNIGTAHMHDEHQAQMLELMKSGALTTTEIRRGDGHMGHDHANSVLLEPGESGELIWRFAGPSDELEFACNVPGHYRAGMHGPFRFGS